MAPLLQGCDIFGDLGYGLRNRLFFGMRVGAFDALPARWTMLRQGDPLLLRLSHAGVRDDVAFVELNLHLVPGLTHFNAASDPGDRHGIAIGVECHIDRKSTLLNSSHL